MLYALTENKKFNDNSESTFHLIEKDKKTFSDMPVVRTRNRTED